jgi:CII-binding regulator of phage lambda lysogenization HflD
VKLPCKRGQSNLSELFVDKRKELAKEVTQSWMSCLWTSEKSLQNSSLKFEWAVFEQEKRSCKRGYLNLSELFLERRKELAKELTQIWVSWFWTSKKILQKRSLKFEWAVFDKCKELLKEVTQIWVSWFWTRRKSLQRRSLKFEWADFERVKRSCKRGYLNLSELFLDKWKDLAKEVTQIWVSCFLTSEITMQKRSIKFEWAVCGQEKRACKRGHSNLSELFFDKWNYFAKEVTQIWVSCFLTSEKTSQKRSLKFEWAVFWQV